MQNEFVVLSWEYTQEVKTSWHPIERGQGGGGGC